MFNSWPPLLTPLLIKLNTEHSPKGNPGLGGADRMDARVSGFSLNLGWTSKLQLIRFTVSIYSILVLQNLCGN